MKSASSFSHTRLSPVPAAPAYGCVEFSNLSKEKPPTGNGQCFLSILSASLGVHSLVQAPGMGKAGSRDKKLTVRGIFEKASWRRNLPAKRDWQKQSLGLHKPPALWAPRTLYNSQHSQPSVSAGSVSMGSTNDRV